MGGFVGFPLLFTLGVHHTSTTHAALILAAAPVLTGLIGFVFEKRRPAWMWWAGAFIAMAGEALLISGGTSGSFVDGATLKGDVLVLLSVLLVSIGYVAGGHLSSRIGSTPTMAWGISLGSLILLPFLIFRLSGGTPVTVSGDRSGWWALVYLALFTSIMAYTLWYRALHQGGVVRMSQAQFFQPVVSLIVAGVFLEERITPVIIIALIIIITGVVLTQRGSGVQESTSSPGEP